MAVAGCVVISCRKSDFPMAKTAYHLHLQGYVGGCDFSRSTVDNTLARLSGRQVNVLIDSTGGALGTGLSISSAFKDHGEVYVHFRGLNASAATIASLGAKHISMDKGAMYLVHQCSMGFFEWGSMNADQFSTLIKDMEKVKADLDKMDANVAALYAARCKRKPEELLDLMREGAWLSSQEALDWGFVDEITDLEEDAAPELSDELAAAMTAEGMPLPWLSAAPAPVSPAAGPASMNPAGPFAKMLGALASLFKSSADDDKPKYMDKNYKCLCGLLGTGSLTLTEGSASLQDAQLAKVEERLAGLEAQVADKDKEIEGLKAKLDAKPAAKTAQVTVNNAGNGSRQEETSDAVAEFCKVNESSRALYDSLP